MIATKSKHVTIRNDDDVVVDRIHIRAGVDYIADHPRIAWVIDHCPELFVEDHPAPQQLEGDVEGDDE